VGKDGKVIPNSEMRFFNTIARFHLYMMLTFKLPLEVREDRYLCYIVLANGGQLFMKAILTLIVKQF
jgi:hypothetical protein